MEPSSGENNEERLLALEQEKKVCIKNIEWYSLSIRAGAFTIGISIVAFVYHLIDTWHSETLSRDNLSFIGIFLSLIGGLIASTMTKQKKAAQLTLAGIEQQIDKLQQATIQ